ncbi:hypothetical protein [Streptomyces sp. NPDC001508]|uniref:hypothetical protein n=1 Tax=Streptomyces sp. NPDC001508 TaxID=3154656 RepID=UPI00331E3D32
MRSGQGDPSSANLPKAQGGGRLDGGVQVRTADGTVRISSDTVTAYITAEGVYTPPKA